MDWNLIGHEWAVQLLRGHIKNDSLRQAYLITGPRGIGKRNLAVRFIQAVLCQNGSSPGDPCLTCSTCMAVEEGSSQIKVDQIREMMHSLSLSPYEAQNRIGLILDIELATSSTQNALLKTLEEPPDPVILVLTASSADSVLETIKSRCEEIKLNTVPISVTGEGLEQIYQVPPDQAKFLAHISGGKPEHALNYHRDPAALERRTSLLDDQLAVLAGGSVERFAYVSQTVSDPDQVQELLNNWFSIWHDVLILAGKSQAPVHNIDRQADLEKILGGIDLTTATRTLGLFRRAQKLLLYNANLKLTLEDLLLQLPQIG
jgi:DNA polymerase-3 subunit delta'